MLGSDAAMSNKSCTMNSFANSQSIGGPRDLEAIAHSTNTTLCLVPRLRSVEILVSFQTTSQNIHLTTWSVFCWLSKQLGMSNNVMKSPMPTLTESNSFGCIALKRSLSPRPSSAKALLCTSPRKRLSLPQKIVISTLDESLQQMYDILLLELIKVQVSDVIMPLLSYQSTKFVVI